MRQLRQDTARDPNKSLGLDLTVGRTLEGFKQDPTLVNYVQQEHQRDSFMKGVGTAGTLLVTGGAMALTKNPGRYPWLRCCCSWDHDCPVRTAPTRNDL